MTTESFGWGGAEPPRDGQGNPLPDSAAPSKPKDVVGEHYKAAEEAAKAARQSSK